MNTTLFISGLGIGFFAAFILVMLLSQIGFRRSRERTIEEDRMVSESAERARELVGLQRGHLLALHERNEIGKLQVTALELIAKHLER